MAFSSAYQSLAAPSNKYQSTYQDAVYPVQSTNYGTRYSDGSVKIPGSSSTDTSYENYQPNPKVLGSGIGPTSSSSSKKSSDNSGPALGSGNTTNSGSIQTTVEGLGTYNSQSDARRAMEDANRYIDDMSSNIFNYINDYRNRLQSGKQDFLNTYTQGIQSQLPLIEQATQQGMDTLGRAVEGAQSMGSNALDDARNLYGELATRNQQLFGSGALSSIGGAANDLLARQQMKSTGDIRTETAQRVQSLQDQMYNLEKESQAKIQSVTLQLEQAKSQAELAFRDKLEELNRYELETKQNMTYEKMNALKDYRDTVMAYNQRVQEYVMQVGLMKEQAKVNLENELAYANRGASDAYTSGANSLDTLGNTLGTANQNMYSNNAISYGDTGANLGDMSAIFGNMNTGRRPEDQYA